MRAFLLVGLVAALACGDDDGGTDAGSDTGMADVGAMDAGGDDAGDDDAGSDDAGGDDAGGDDAGGDDAGADDAGADDAGTDDAGADDAGGDSGIMACAASTIRFDSPLPQMTNGSGDDFNPSGDDCPFAIATGPDRVYALVPSLGVGTYRVTATPVADDWNPMIYTITDCTGDMCIDGSNLNGVGEADSMDIVIEDESTIVYVVVDTALTGDINGGPFMLSAELL